MIARASELFLPTLREAPADADAASHKLLVRAGFTLTALTPVERKLAMSDAIAAAVPKTHSGGACM